MGRDERTLSPRIRASLDRITVIQRYVVGARNPLGVFAYILPISH